MLKDSNLKSDPMTRNSSNIKQKTHDQDGEVIVGEIDIPNLDVAGTGHPSEESQDLPTIIRKLQATDKRASEQKFSSR